MDEEYLIPYDKFLEEARDKLIFPKSFNNPDGYGHLKGAITWEGRTVRLQSPWLKVAFSINDGKMMNKGGANASANNANAEANAPIIAAAPIVAPQTSDVAASASSTLPAGEAPTKKAKFPPMHLTLSLSTGEIKKDDDEYKFRQCLSLLHELLLKAVRDNSKAWLDKETPSAEFIEEKTMPIMDYTKEKVTKRPKVEFGLVVKATLNRYPVYDSVHNDVEPSYVQGGIYEMVGKGENAKPEKVLVNEKNVTTFLREKDYAKAVLEIDGISFTSHKNIKYKVKVYQLGFKRVKQVPSHFLLSTNDIPTMAGEKDDVVVGDEQQTKKDASTSPLKFQSTTSEEDSSDGPVAKKVKLYKEGEEKEDQQTSTPVPSAVKAEGSKNENAVEAPVASAHA